MLSDQHDAVLIVEGHDAGRQIPEVDDAVDAGTAVGSRDLVVPDGDPWVLIGDAPAVADEPTLHPGIVARRGHARRGFAGGP
jgi:hypothetical protein